MYNASQNSPNIDSITPNARFQNVLSNIHNNTGKHAKELASFGSCVNTSQYQSSIKRTDPPRRPLFNQTLIQLHRAKKKSNRHPPSSQNPITPHTHTPLYPQGRSRPALPTPTPPGSNIYSAHQRASKLCLARARPPF